MVYTNEIIEAIKAHPILFNSFHPDYKCKRLRDAAWDTLSLELKETRNELRKKWKNIRDCYKKYLRSVNFGASSATLLRSYKNWQWAEKMVFYKPYIMSESEVNYDPENNEEMDDSFSENSQAIKSEKSEESLQNLETSHNPQLETPNKSNQFRHDRDHVLNGLDATDMIFLGYSSIVKSFTPTKQAIVKMKIAQIIMEEELHHAEGISFQSHLICKPSSSKSSTVNNSSTEIDFTVEQAEVTTNVGPPKQKRSRKRKIKSPEKEEPGTFNITMNDEDDNIVLIKSEIKDIPESD